MKDSGINYSSLVEESLMRQFWEQHWMSNNLGWDIGYASPPIIEYMKQYEDDKDIAILIPGCGNAYEAEHLLDQGFTNITVIDISPTAVQRLKEKFRGKEGIQIVCADFFAHNKLGYYELILEQTFFCALNPDRRAHYVAQTAQLLKPTGKLAGVLFGVEFDREGPPFGGIKAEYAQLFSPYFHLRKLEDCYNSIEPRKGNELFIEFQPKTAA